MDCFSPFALRKASWQSKLITLEESGSESNSSTLDRFSLSLSLFHRYDRSHFVDKLEISGNCYAIDRVSKHRGPVMSHAIFSHITTSLKRHQLELIRSNKKLCFYSIFKTDVSRSDYLEQVKNQKHRRAVAKLRSGNHSLRIESGRHCIPKLPESLRICQ